MHFNRMVMIKKTYKNYLKMIVNFKASAVSVTRLPVISAVLIIEK